MIRVLFIILAVVSMVLAFVLSISWLYLVSAGMLVTAGVILTLDTKKRIRRTAVAGSKPAPVVEKKDDLKSLGIMEIRPVAAKKSQEVPESGVSTAATKDRGGDSGTTQATVERVNESEAVAATVASVSRPSAVPVATPVVTPVAKPTAPAPTQNPPDDASRIGVVRKRTRTAKIMVEGVSESLPGEVILSTLRAIRAAVDATTVTLLKQETGPLGYSVEAIVSRNSFARSGGRFMVAEPLVTSQGLLTPVVLRCNGSGGFNARRLGYYHEPIAIHKVAFCKLGGDDGAYLLVADSMLDEAFEDPEAVRMLREFARLTQALVTGSSAHGGDDSGRDKGIRPRREIIAEEIDAARVASQPLALALVHLHKGEMTDFDRREVEAALGSRLSQSTKRGRVERFGELTFGVLQQEEVDAVADWASRLQKGFHREAGALGGGISIGVAMLDKRHETPDALRADATAALRESYETGECIILE